MLRDINKYCGLPHDGMSNEAIKSIKALLDQITVENQKSRSPEINCRDSRSHINLSCVNYGYDSRNILALEGRQIDNYNGNNVVGYSMLICQFGDRIGHSINTCSYRLKCRILGGHLI